MPPTPSTPSARRGRLAALVLLTLIVAPGAAALGDDVPPPREQPATEAPPTTQLEYCDAVFRRLKEGTADVYQRTHDDPPELAERATAWLVLVARADAGLGGAPPWKVLREQGEALLEGGCEHPLVVGYLAHLNLHGGRVTRSRELHERAGPTLLAGSYGPLARFYEAWRWFLTETMFTDNRPKRIELATACHEGFLALARSESESVVRQRMLWDDALSVRRPTWPYCDGTGDLLRKVWAEEGRGCHAWLRWMSSAKAWYEHAWSKRGGGYATEVDEDRWEPFYEGVAKAESIYVEAHEMAPELPEAATALIGAVMAKQDTQVEDLRYWFDRATEAQVDHAAAYHNLLWAMRPRWYGSHGEMFELANEWVDAGRADTDVPYMAVQAVYDVGSEVGGRAAALQPEETYLLVTSALQQMADHPLHAPGVRRNYTRRWLLTHQMAAAIVSGRDDDARRLLDTLEEEGLRPHASAMSDYGLDRLIHTPRLVARTSLAAAQVRALADLSWEDKHADRGALERTIEAYAAAKRAVGDPRADHYFDHWIGQYTMERDFLDGQVVEPAFVRDLIAWDTPYRGLWEIEGDRTAVARKSHDSNWPSLWNAAFLPGPIEVEVEVESIHETGPETGFGVRIGGGDADDAHGLYFWINTTAGVASATPVERDVTWTEPIPPGKKRFVMVARGWPGHAELWLDGERVFAREDPGFRPDGRFALAARYKSPQSAEVRYSNVRVRRLEPREDAADPE